MTTPSADKRAVEKRKPLNRAQVIALMIKQATGPVLCGCGCGEPLEPFVEGVIDEHWAPLAQTGTNDLRNRALLRKPCAKRKTRKDSGDTAKCKRLAGETCTARGRPIPQRAEPMQGRGFDKTKTRGFGGQVRPRAPSPPQHEGEGR